MRRALATREMKSVYVPLIEVWNSVSISGLKPPMKSGWPESGVVR